MKIFVGSIFVLFASIASSNELPNCDIEKSKEMFFSNDDVKDTLLVRIKGSPCHKADLDISIKDKNGLVRYEYHAPFKSHITVQWNDPTLADDANKLAENVFQSYHFGVARKLPVWLPEEEYYEENYQEIKVSKKYYLSLLSKNWPTFSHNVHYEGWKVIVFDKDKNEFVLISEGGL